MCLYMCEHPSSWSDSSFPHPADALYILLVLFTLSLKLMIDFFVLGWFRGFSTWTTMGWDAAWEERLKSLPTGEQTHPFFPATMGGCGQDPAPRRAWSCGRVPGGAQMDITVWGLLLPNRDGAVPQPASRSLVCSMLAKIKWNADTVESWLGHKVVFVRAASLLHPVSLQHNFPPLPNANWKTAMDLWTSGGNSTPFLLLHCILIEKETPWQHQSLDIVQAPHASLIWVLLSQGRQPTGGLVQPQGLPSNWNEVSWGEGSLKAAASPALPSGQVYSPLRQAPPWHHSFHSYPDQGPISALGDGQPWSLFLTHPGSSLQGCG